jgi:CRP-like cAMP-binding protein
MPPPMTSLATHPERNSIRLQLRQNQLLKGMTAAQWAELEPLLAVADYGKGEPLVRQGDEEMEQFFILEGMLKRVVSNTQGREMILRFAAESEMDTSYAAWRLRTPVPYSIVAVTKVRTAELPMPLWAEFIERHPEIKLRFEYEVMKLMSEVMAHTITLHLLDAPGRLSRFQRKHPELAGRIPKKELAAYLNLTPETLSRLRQKVGG